MRDFELLQAPCRWSEVNERCGLAMLRNQAGVTPAPVAASHGLGIEPCRHRGNGVLDA
jgi:hypothetical protein